MKQIITKPLTLRRTCAASILTTLFLLFAGYTSGWAAETHEVYDVNNLEFWLNNAQNGDIIKVKDNIEVYYNVSFNNTVTLDLNGKTINFVHQFPINGGKLTIEGPGIIDVSPIEINDGELILNSGTISSDRNESIYLKSGSVTVNGGSVISTNNVALHIIGGTFTVSGGSVISTSGAALNLAGGTCTITGGQIGDEGKPGLNVVNNATASITGGTVWMYDLNGTMTVSGGTVKGDFDLWDSGILNICAGATMECNITNWGGTVNIAADVAASVTVGNTTTYYAILQDDDAETADAVSAALAAYSPASGETPAVVPTITLLQNIDLSGNSLRLYNYDNETAVILDLNGKTISGGSNTAIEVAEGGKLTVTGNGNINSNVYAISIGSGEVTIENGTFSGDYDAIYNLSGTLTISGGIFNSTANDAINICEDATASISDGTFTGRHNGIVNNGGKLTITGGTFTGEGDPDNAEYPGIAIKNYAGELTVSGCNIINSDFGIKNDNYGNVVLASLTVKGLPAFSGNDVDIYLDNGNKIVFDEAITAAPAVPIIVDVANKTNAFTDGYTAKCDDIDPARFFVPASGNCAASLESGEVKFINGTGPITFAKAGYSTYFDSSNKIQLLKGMKAYIVTGEGTTGTGSLAYKLIADGDSETPGENIIPANTAVLLQVVNTVADQHLALPDVDINSSYTGGDNNWLHGSDTETDIPADPNSLFYKLSYSSDCDEFGWYWGAENGVAFQNPAHKAYLALPASAGSRSFSLPDYGETTGIADANSKFAAHDSRIANSLQRDGWYTIDGQKFSGMPTAKGVYIHNNKKIIIK